MTYHTIFLVCSLVLAVAQHSSSTWVEEQGSLGLANTLLAQISKNVPKDELGTDIASTHAKLAHKKELKESFTTPQPTKDKLAPLIVDLRKPGPLSLSSSQPIVFIFAKTDLSKNETVERLITSTKEILKSTVGLNPIGKGISCITDAPTSESGTIAILQPKIVQLVIVFTFASNGQMMNLTGLKLGWTYDQTLAKLAVQRARQLANNASLRPMPEIVSVEKDKFSAEYYVLRNSTKQIQPDELFEIGKAFKTALTEAFPSKNMEIVAALAFVPDYTWDKETENPQEMVLTCTNSQHVVIQWKFNESSSNTGTKTVEAKPNTTKTTQAPSRTDTSTNTAVKQNAAKDTNVQKLDAQTLKKLREDALATHNELRALHGAPPLHLDEKLCNYAQEWADKLASGKVKGHRPQELYGENLFTGPIDTYNPVREWYNEIKDYNFKNPGFSSKTGHFTQVVWYSTEKVGIGFAPFKMTTPTGHEFDAFEVVANYAVAGNNPMKGQFKENVKPLSSAVVTRK